MALTVESLMLEGGKVVLSLAEADSFLAAIPPSGAIERDADLLVRSSSATELHFDGEAGLRTTRELHRRPGPLWLDSLDVALADPLTEYLACVMHTFRLMQGWTQFAA